MKVLRKIDDGAAVGNVAVVSLLAAQPPSTFNNAYKFSEPLRRSCRAFLKSTDPIQKQNLSECAILIAAANANIDEPDPYYSNHMSASEMLNANGSVESLQLLHQLREKQSKSIEKAVGKKRDSKEKPSKKAKRAKL